MLCGKTFYVCVWGCVWEVCIDTMKTINGTEEENQSFRYATDDMIDEYDKQWAEK